MGFGIDVVFCSSELNSQDQFPKQNRKISEDIFDFHILCSMVYSDIGILSADFRSHFVHTSFNRFAVS